MATNWSAYDAAKEIYGTNKETIAEIGSRFPLFTRTVALANSDFLLDILQALPKVTARVVETGLKDMEDAAETEEAQEEVKEEKKETKKAAAGKKATKTKKVEEEPEEEEEASDYESMTSKELYKLCCDRGISSQCKKRDKASLIAVLKANEGNSEAEADDEDWDEEEEENTDPYEGKTAKELYKMCVDRGIKAKMKQSADAYVKLLKKADEEEAESEDDEDDDDDDWEI